MPRLVFTGNDFQMVTLRLCLTYLAAINKIFSVVCVCSCAFQYKYMKRKLEAIHTCNVASRIQSMKFTLLPLVWLII